MELVYEWFRELYQTTGINLPFIYDSYDRGRLIDGFLTTVELSLICLFFSVVIGIIGAWLQGSSFTWTRRIVNGYIQLFRNTPPLVQLYFFYFAIGSMLPRVETEWGGQAPMLGSFAWAVISLSFFAGAFNVEIFRSGIEAVPKSTVEAAESLGFSRFQIYRDVTLPLAIRVVLPSLNNNLVNLVKTTTLAYAIAVPEMLYESAQIWSDNVNVPEMMIFLLIAYFVLVGILVWGMNRWERALKIPGFGS
ncbi:MAG TPA: polar amino acid ABC transporter permease [Rhodospirillaceae bacterium]|nr:polar amino acid ABC transporter permease [Rhodospirillaceae bacterium]MAX61195.1 polar amino acid ABC transporter permease [Rhodospirillaceae bacterium]MBB55937.1 polar amino acid ABC transporter permease [Rhodospirillaceae bacterium]HAJ20127.1 polar amino acid ABC transporter permease [Rhodospirillaceae bacterium]HBM14227.1 polar amino acid ABC transporter permease [Rhodospirillaceae bacterium]|tara:strand:+ start:1115 stop:1861 length:747 start_codon:yes stop_codon:yes gene_type:complete